MLKSWTLSPFQGSVGNGSASRPAFSSAGVERGLGHLQRRQDAFGQERAQALAADDFDDAAEDVGGAAVVPFRAGLAHQRQARDDGGVLGIGDLAAAQPRLLVQLLHQAVAGVVVGDARGVAQQILDRHRPLQRHEVELAVVLDADLLVGKFRNELRDGIVEQEVAVLDQHHDADGDDRLGHREDAEDGVVRHRRGGRRALLAERVEPADLAAARDHHGRAGQGSLVDLALEGVRHALQADGRQPERFRLGLRQRRGLRGGGVLGGGLRVHGLSRLLLSLLAGQSGADDRIEQALRRRSASVLPRRNAGRPEPSAPVPNQGRLSRFALANRARRLCLKRRERRRCQVPCRECSSDW